MSDISKPAPPPRWHLIYYLLAAFDILTISGGLYLNHLIMTIYVDSVSVNQAWATRLAGIDELRNLTIAVNAPGNDVFDSHDVDTETAKRASALVAFQDHLKATRQEIVSNVAPGQANDLLSGLDAVQVAMSSMLAEADLIFSHFRNGETEKAGRRMATMDRKFAQVSIELASAAEKVRAIQTVHFRTQVSSAQELRIFEFLIGAIIVIIVVFVSLYGHKISKEIKRAADEKEKFDADRRQADAEIFEAMEAEKKVSIAREKAEAANVTKSAFLAAMSHEIRTPMNGVIGMIDLLQQTKLTSNQNEMVDTVRNSAYALLTIINDILDFSKIEAGKLGLELIPMSICDAVEDVAEILSTTARNKAVGLRVFVDPNIPDAVMGDQVRIRQILLNLAGNAVKFTEKGGVLIRADLLEDSSEVAASLRIRIIDSGIGLTEEGKARLFQAFSQADESTMRRFGGTGLGLAISQRLTEMMGGEIEVESVFGEGSTFSVTMTLPVAYGHNIESDGYDLGGVNVLCVINNALVPRYLEHWGVKVTVFDEIGDIPAALIAAVQEGVLDNVVYMASGWLATGGAEIITEIQSHGDIADTPFVVATSSRNRDEREQLKNVIYLETLPLRRSAFIRAIAVAAGRAKPDVIVDDAIAPETVKEPPSVEAAENAGQLILLAEDNVTNQKVIVRQLQNLGFAAEITNDGKEALEALGKKSYAILLTDCHMPNLDGFGLTEAVRHGEEGTGKRLPIVAISASAMKEEVDRCFAIGMDDFLSKPVEMSKLKYAVQRWMSVPEAPAVDMVDESPGDTGAPSSAPTGDGPIDTSALMAVFGDDDETIKEVLLDFVEPSGNIVADIEAAVAERSAKDVRDGGHKLKSSSRAIGANALADLCAELDLAGKSQDWPRIENLIPELAPRFKAVVDHIERL